MTQAQRRSTPTPSASPLRNTSRRLAVACVGLLGLSVTGLSSCKKVGGDAFTVSPESLKPGGVYVAFVNGCEKGCAEMRRGDLIHQIDGQDVSEADRDAARALTDGEPHTLSVHRDGQELQLEVVAQPIDMPPIGDIPPFWTVGAADLDKAPEWARRRMFGHASPRVDLINIDGGYVTGRSMYGKPHFVVYYDWATSTQQQDGSMFFQVIQQAQPHLNAAGYEIIFAQMPFPGRSRIPMTDTDLRRFHEQNRNKKKELPPVQMYRLPNAKESNSAREVGLEGTYTVRENLNQAPEIVILDAHGIVRWHSAGLEPDPEQKMVDQLYTIDAAANWALDVLAPEFTNQGSATAATPASAPAEEAPSEEAE